MFLLAASAALLIASLTSASYPYRAVIWGGLALAAYSSAILCIISPVQEAGLGLSRWKFGPWIAVWYALAYGLTATTWSQSMAGTTVAMISIQSVLRALWLVAVGLTAWTIGYLIGPSRILASASRRGVTALGLRFSPDVRSLVTPYLLYGIGTLARVASAAATGRFGYLGNTASSVEGASGYQQLLNVLQMCAPLAVAAAALQVFRQKRRGARVALISLLAVELAVSAASGDKVNFLNAMLAVIVPWSAVHLRLPKSLIVVGILAFFVIVIPFSSTYRQSVRSNGNALSTVSALQQFPTVFTGTLSGSQMLPNMAQSFSYLASRIQEVDSPAIIIQKTPDVVPYLSPAQLVELPLSSLIPRAIWTGKPIYVPMYQVSQEYYDQPASLIQAAGITPVGDLFRYGGWVPVVVGMFALGAAVRLLDGFLEIGNNPHAVFLVLLLFPSVVVAESGWVAIFMGIPSTLFIWLFSIFITFRATPRGGVR